MKAFRYLFFLFIIIFITISCSEKDNPTEPIHEDNKWMEIKCFEELQNPIMHFFNANEGIIAGGVHYDKPIFTTYINANWFLEDTIRILTPELTDTLTPPKYPLWKTYDGGLTWKPIEGYFRTSIRDLKFVDELIGFVVTDTEGVFKTTDGGENWHRIFGAEVLFASQGISAYGKPTEIDFYDENNGILFLSQGLYEFVYLSTKDGGINWDFASSPFIMENLIFPEDNNKTGYANTWNSIVKTEDGGQTWNSIREFSKPNKFAFMNHNNGVYYSDGKLFWTSDGGYTFKKANDFTDSILFYHFRWSINKIFFSNDFWYITADEEIGISVDSCQSFNLISFENQGFVDIICPEKNIFYGVTNDGHFYKLVRKD